MLGTKPNLRMPCAERGQFLVKRRKRGGGGGGRRKKPDAPEAAGGDDAGAEPGDVPADNDGDAGPPLMTVALTANAVKPVVVLTYRLLAHQQAEGLLGCVPPVRALGILVL